MLACMAVSHLQDTVQTVQALKGAGAQMRGAMKTNKELDLNFIDNLQVCTEQRMPCQLRAGAAIDLPQLVGHSGYAVARVQHQMCGSR